MNNIKFGRMTAGVNKHIPANADVFYMCSSVPEAVEYEGHGFAEGVKAYAIPCKVLRPEGPTGSFKPMDDQAKAIGAAIMERHRRGHDIVILCDHAEIRSPAVAMGLAMAFNVDYEPIGGAMKEGHSSTFSNRTVGWVHDTVEKILLEKERAAAC